MGYLFAIGLVLLLALSASYQWGERGQGAIDRLEVELERQQKVTAMLVNRNDRLREEVRELDSGTYMIEARARRDLGMVREGETFFQVVETADGDTRRRGDPSSADGD